MRNILFVLLMAFIHAADACPIEFTRRAPLLNGSAIENILASYFGCSISEPLLDRSPCNILVAKAMSDVYAIEDFKTMGGYYDANQIAQNLADGFKEWKPIGVLLDEKNSTCAQVLANAGYPVIAALSEKDHGHVALIIPGKLQKSWKGFHSPNSASFMLDTLRGSYIGKPLSNSFGKTKAKLAKYYYHEPNSFVTAQLIIRDRESSINQEPVIRPPRD